MIVVVLCACFANCMACKWRSPPFAMLILNKKIYKSAKIKWLKNRVNIEKADNDIGRVRI